MAGKQRAGVTEAAGDIARGEALFNEGIGTGAPTGRIVAAAKIFADAVWENIIKNAPLVPMAGPHSPTVRQAIKGAQALEVIISGDNRGQEATADR